jgi:hypothetical protein
LFFLLIVFCGTAAGCNTLQPKHLRGGAAGENYQFYLSQGIELRSPDFTDTITIYSDTPGRLRAKDSVRHERAQTNSSMSLNVMIVRIVFGDNDNEFLEFAAAEDQFDKKFYLLFSQNPQDRDRKKIYVMYKGREYSLTFLITRRPDGRPYLLYTNPPRWGPTR